MVGPPQRADAQENREAIVRAARAVIAGTDHVKLNEIAKRAGVGQGTLYRHFPSREHLLAEVYRHEVGELVASASTLLAHHDPIVALAHWLERVADYARVKRELMAAVEVGVWQDLVHQSHGPIGDAITELLDAGRADGSIRPDVDALDVILLIGFLARLDMTHSEARARHLLTVVLDGLRASAEH